MKRTFKDIKVGNYFRLEHIDLGCKKLSESSFKVIGGSGVVTNVEQETIVITF